MVKVKAVVGTIIEISVKPNTDKNLLDTLAIIGLISLELAMICAEL